MKNQIVSLPAASGPVAPTARDIASAAARACPVVDTINVDKSTDVHIGAKIVSVVQNIDNSEKVKGRFLCLELVSKLNKSRRSRCSVVIFLCWAIVICVGLAVYLTYALFYVHPYRLDIGINASWYLRRSDWQAIDAFSVTFLSLPVSNVIIGHSAFGYCNNRYHCSERTLTLQRIHISQGRLVDISPNFVVGGNGYVMEGRGANVQGGMFSGWNDKSITVMFFGDYQFNETDDAQIDNLKTVLYRLVELDVLIPDYDLYGVCQLRGAISPGRNLFKRLEEFPRWNQLNINNCPRS